LILELIGILFQTSLSGSHFSQQKKKKKVVIIFEFRFNIYNTIHM